MKKRIKWFIPFFLVLMLMAGCTSGGQQVDGEKKNTNSSSNDGSTTLNFLAHSNYEAPLKKVIQEFEKENPDIKVNLELAPFSQLMESIEIKLGSGSEDTDVLFVDSPLVVNYSLKGYLEPLNELLGGNAKESWVSSAVETVTYNDQLMAAPMNNSSMVLYYNKAIFEEKGIPFPAEDERHTWEEIIDMAKQLTYDDGEKQIFGFSLDRVGTAYQFLAIPESLGVDMLSEDGLTSNGFTNSPEAIEAFTFYLNLFNEWKVSPKISQDESVDYFVSGKVAMLLGLTHNVPKLEESDIDYGISLHPFFEDGEVATPTGSWNIGISKYSQNKEEAAKFIEYLTIGAGAKIMFEEGATLPVHVDLLDSIFNDPKFAEFPNNVMKIAAKESQETAAPRPKTPGYLEWDSNMSKVLEDIKNGADPKATVDEVVNVIDNLLKKYEGL